MVIIAYGPNEDEISEKKDIFWDSLLQTMEGCKGYTFVIGNLNTKVG